MRGRSEELAEAVPEALKNMLLVMAAQHVLVPSWVVRCPAFQHNISHLPGVEDKQLHTHVTHLAVWAVCYSCWKQTSLVVALIIQHVWHGTAFNMTTIQGYTLVGNNHRIVDTSLGHEQRCVKKALAVDLLVHSMLRGGAGVQSKQMLVIGTAWLRPWHFLCRQWREQTCGTQPGTGQR